MSDQEINVKFGGSTDGLDKAANAAKDAVKGVVEGMTEELKTLGGIGNMITGVFAAMVAVFSVDKIKEGIQSVVAEASDVNKFASTLGITIEKASELNMTLSLLGIENGTYSAAIMGLTRSLKSNQEVFEQNGIAIKDSNGNLLDSGTIMQSTIAFLNGMKDGTERNLAAQALMGRGWRQLTELQRINNDTTEKGAKFAKDLNQVLGKENVEAMHAYKMAMAGMDEVSEAMIQILGESFMPIVTKVGEWFMDIGPTAVEMFQKTMDTLMTVINTFIDLLGMVWEVLSTVWNSIGDLTHAIFGNEMPASLNIFKFALAVVQELVIGFRLSIEIAFTVIKASLAETAAFMVMFGNVAKAVLTLDFEGAKAAWTSGMADIKGIASTALDDIMNSAAKARKELDEAFNGKAKESGDKGDDKDGVFKPKNKATKGKETNRMGDWKAEFEEYKIGQANYFKDYNEEELAFWEAKLKIQGISRKEYLAVEKEIYSLRSAMAKDALSQQIADMDEEIALQKNNIGLKIAVLTQESELIKGKYGERSKEYRAMLSKIRDAEEEFQDEQRKLQEGNLEAQREMDILKVEQKRQNLEFEAEMGTISAAQQLEALAALKEEEYQIELKFAQDKAALQQLNVVEYQKAQESILIMAEKHKVEMDKINKGIVKAQVDQWKELLEPITGAFEKSAMGVIQGTTKLRKALSNMLQSIILSYAQMGIKVLANWVATQLGLTAATSAGVSQRTAIEAAGQSVGLAQMASTALKTIGNYAVETFAAIYKALAGIPFIGPFLAPAAAASGMAVVAGMAGSIMSAEGGYDIPAGMNPITQLHEKEMVLPKEQADTIRNMSNQSGSKIVINTTGGDFIHKDQLGKLLKTLNRNFVSIR